MKRDRQVKIQMEDPRRPQGKFPNQGGFNHGNQMTGARIPQGKIFQRL